ncbi:MAG TPA: glutamate--tRNA ligase, partial [Nitrososphaeraceae archaeon]|nr:glutamate--tRNA ligase [Nitrososphaeraceae archaeon]
IIKVTILKNAIEYSGKSRVDPVIAKVIAYKPDLRASLRNLIPKIAETVQKINALSLADQKALLSQIEPRESQSKKKQSEISRAHLPPLEFAEMGKVVTRFPPEPNGYPHIGHAKAAIIDEEYARMYNGKLILRFDDTNPLNEKLEYYEAIRAGLEWLGIKPDLVKNSSDDIQLLHEYGKKLVLSNAAYVCTCTQKAIHDLREKKVPCECRSNFDITLDRLKKMFDGSFAQNEAIIRFKGDMSDQNTAMRDPTLFRIIEADHPKLGNKIRVWPTYDFAVPVEDSLDGVTHAMRTKEYELRNALYFAIIQALGLRKPFMLEFSRLEFKGVPVSKRKLKPLLEKGIVNSWSDPRLPTLIAIKRRGFLPEAIRKFVLSLGLTLAETKPPIEALEAFNRRLIDPDCMRLSFVKDPVELQIQNASPKNITLKNHPIANLGTRKVRVSNSLYIARDDASKLDIGDEIRLMDLYNIQIIKIITSKNRKQLLIANSTGDDIKQNMSKIHWVAKDDAIPYKIMVAKDLYIGDEYNTNSLEIFGGFAESFVSTLKPDTRIQFVRFGFCRLDGNNTAIFTHR